MRAIEPSRKNTVKQVFDGYIEDTITDEQIVRILEPVLMRIKSGVYDRPRGFFKNIFHKRAI